jgi:predicted nucleotidyltransferase
MTRPRALPPDLAATASRLVDRIRAALPEVQAVYAYGSRVRGGGHPASDLDLALLVPRQARFEPLALLALRGDLELVAGCPVELAVLDPGRGLVHCKEVVAYGATLYVGDRRAVDDFEMQVLADYARLCEERRLVVDAYRETRRG